MRIAVVGATGLVGRHVVEALSKADNHAVVATWRARKPYQVANVSWVRCDLQVPADAARVLDGADVAILCAGRPSTSAVLRLDPVESVLQTLRMVTNVLEAAGRLRLSRVVLVSSCTGYPALGRPAVETDMARDDPPSQWFGVGWMHRYLEKQVAWYADHLRLIGSAVILRPTLIYGPHDDFSPETGHFVPVLMRKVVDRVRPIDIWGDGTQRRNLLYAADLAGAILAVLTERSERLEIFNVASPDDVSINEIVAHLIEIDGFADAAVTHDATKGGSPSALAVCSSAFGKATGWIAHKNVWDGLADTMAWYRSHMNRRRF
jgi:GDP-L-fucose synthase